MLGERDALVFLVRATRAIDWLHAFAFIPRRYQYRYEPFARFIVGRLVTEVGIVQLRVVTALRHQRLVTALLDDATTIQHDDAIRVANGREAMGNDNRATPLE